MGILGRGGWGPWVNPIYLKAWENYLLGLSFATDVSGWSVGGLGVSSGVSGHALCGLACGGQARPGLGRGGDTEDCKLEPAVRQSPGLGAVQSSLVTGAHQASAGITCRPAD